MAKRSWPARKADITVTLPKPMTSNSKAAGRLGKQDFRYVAGEDVDLCPAGERLPYRFTNEENGLLLRRYWTNACQGCAIKRACATGKGGGSLGGSMSTSAEPLPGGIIKAV